MSIGAAFAPLFSERVWGQVQVLLAGVLLAPARRTVAAALRMTGRHQHARFHRYHRVLSRARWFGLAVGRVLLRLLVAAFVPDAPLVFGIDEMLERRGKRASTAPMPGSTGPPCTRCGTPSPPST